jgi:hypothetical protein
MCELAEGKGGKETAKEMTADEVMSDEFVHVLCKVNVEANVPPC